MVWLNNDLLKMTLNPFCHAMEKVSRSEQKRRFKLIEAAAKELSVLGDSELTKLPGSDRLNYEIVAVRKTKGGARKRQIKYVAKILQEEPVDEILSFLQQIRGSKLEENRFHRTAEKMRDAIIDDALQEYENCIQGSRQMEIDWHSEVIRKTMDALPELDEHEVRRSAYQYARNRNKTYYRELFRLLKAAADKKRRIQPEQP